MAALASFLAAARRNPWGVIQISTSWAQGVSTTTSRWILALQANAINARSGCLEVDGARVALLDELGPRRARVGRLTERKVKTCCGILHALHHVSTDCVARLGNDRLRVLRH